MLTTGDTAKMLDLKKRIEKLSPGDQLRLCAGLLDQGGEGNFAIVETLAGRVINELRAARLLFGK